MQDFAFEAHQRKAVASVGGKREALFDKLQGVFLTIFTYLRASRGQISLGSLGVLGPIEMFGVQYRIAIGVPLRCTPMQLPAPAPEQGVIDYVAD